MSRLPADRARLELLRALEPHAAPFALIASTSKDWASGLFVGARHRFAVALQGEDRLRRARTLEEALPDCDLPLRSGFVADVAVATRLDGDRPVLAIEALTIFDAEPVSRDVRRAG